VYLHLNLDFGPPENILSDHQSKKNAVHISSSTLEFSMPVLNPRSRKISVRLSEEEYTSLRRLCFATAERNVSDLTRRAVRELLSGTSREGVFRSDLEEFRSHMRRLDQRIDELAAEFSTLKTD